jgi:hypothetical protein
MTMFVYMYTPTDWRGKSNGGHIRGNNYLSFPRFRLIDLASRPENRDKGLFDVRITQWHEWHCTGESLFYSLNNAFLSGV